MRHYCSDHKRPHNRLSHVITNSLIFFEHAYLCNCRNTTNIITAECAALLLHFQKVMSLIFSQRLTVLTEYFWWFSSTRLCKYLANLHLHLLCLLLHLFQFIIHQSLTIQHYTVRHNDSIINPLVPNSRYTHHTVWCSKCWVSGTDDGHLTAFVMQLLLNFWSPAHSMRHLIPVPKG